VRARARPRRFVRRSPDLTSLFDVLFIVVFVALIRAAAAQQAAAALASAPPAPPPVARPPLPPAPPPTLAALRAAALSHVERDLAGRSPLVARVATRADRGRIHATLVALELSGSAVPLDVPLLTDSRDPDVEVAYLGDSSSELRLCRIAAVHLRAPDLARYLVIIAPDRPAAELKREAGSRALLEGLAGDVSRCLVEQRGIAALIDPSALPRPTPDRSAAGAPPTAAPTPAPAPLP
jgi:hypothetical protein